MRILKFILIKEFKQIFRNKALLPMIFITPLIQLLVMPFAANYEIKNINISIVDHDKSTYSQKLTADITASGYFKLTDFGTNYDNAFKRIESDQADLILEIPKGFERNIVRENGQNLFIAVNAINGTKATVGSSYLSSIISSFNNQIRLKLTQPSKFNKVATIQATSTNWFNTFLNYKNYMVPGILVSLVTMIAMYMCALNIVKEKEIGTIEQINVTPIKKIHFILGKMIPFWIIGIFIFAIGLFGIGRLVFGIIPLGNIWLVYLFLTIFLISLLGIGLLISTYCETQQQAMTIAFFFMMIFLLMSGLFTSLDSMPEWAKIIARCNPVTYFIEVMRMVVLKGSEFKDIQYNFWIVTAMAILFNSWAILIYKKIS
jgi:ABC-2 type transport system permease protein